MDVRKLRQTLYEAIRAIIDLQGEMGRLVQTHGYNHIRSELDELESLVKNRIDEIDEYQTEKDEDHYQAALKATQ